ncbi:hypothetical protein D9756_006722 [Leucocoprinus leucothites]|uniref:Uncharacterized protein n=1 Tax=Leucocoprinus leucothites TaxID=201217 RepID=A0A8H5LGE9_9AGAR|nr:hypothetical protein D9756_006722 [Leucoagaricus leucothites]
MHGSGTRDSPIAIDDESEDENVITYGHRAYSFTPPDDLLLSPRPGTFLSTVSRPRLTAMPTQAQKEGSKQPRKRKHKGVAAPTQSLPAGLSVQHHQQNSVLPPVKQEIPVDGTKFNEHLKESKRQKKLRAKLERERLAQELRAKATGKQKAPNVNILSAGQDQRAQISTQYIPLQDENAPPAKRAKHSKSTAIMTHPLDRMPLASGPVPGPSEKPASQSAASTSYGIRLEAAQTFHLPDPSSVPPPTIAPLEPHYFGDHVPSLPPRPPVSQVPFDSYMDPASMMSSMQMQSQYGMEFDPLLPWLYMSMGAFPPPMSMNPIPMPSMPMQAAPTDQPLPHANPAPQKAASNTKSKAAKHKQKSETIQLPQRPSLPEKPFTIRAFIRGSEDWAQSVSYLPIGKPDLQFKHGIFPIIPSIMLPSSRSKLPSGPATDQSSYVPGILSTLVLENVPKQSCKISWVEKWCFGVTGTQPKQVLLGPRRALVEFREPGDAVKAWASRRLGTDGLGNRVSCGQAGEMQNMVAYWYRPDLEQEKGLLELWKHSKKMLPEITNVTVVKNENVVLRAVEAALDVIREKMEPKEREEGEVDECENGEGCVDRVMGININSLSQNWSAPDVKGEFRKLAERLGFRKKYENAASGGMNEDHLLVWEQQETARIDRARSIAYARHKRGEVIPRARKRKPEEDEEGELKEPKRKRARTAASEDILVRQSSAPMATASTSTAAASVQSNSQTTSYVSTSTSAAPPPALKAAKPAVSVAPRRDVEPANTPTVTSLPSKPYEPLPTTSNTDAPQSMLVSAFGGPVSAPRTTSKFTFSSIATSSASSTSTQWTSSVIKPPRGFGLSFAIPSPTSISSQSSGTQSSSKVAALPTPPLSVPLLATPLPLSQARGKKRAREDDSVGASTSRALPVLRPSELLIAVQQKQKKSDVKDSLGFAGAPELRPSTLLTVVKEKEKEEDLRASQTSESAKPVMGSPGAWDRTSHGGRSGGAAMVVDNLMTAPSFWRDGEASLANGLRVDGQALVSQTSPPLSTLAAPNTPPLAPAIPVSATPEPQVKLNPTASKPLAPGISLSLSQIGEKDIMSGPISSISSSDMVISPVSEKAMDFPLPATVTGVSAVSSQAPEDKMPLEPEQAMPALAISAVLSASTPIPSTIPVKALIPAPVNTISPKALAELTKMLTRPKEERQASLDKEFKATKDLMDQLMATTCKKQRKRITDLWKEKIRCASFLIGVASCVH